MHSQISPIWNDVSDAGHRHHASGVSDVEKNDRRSPRFLGEDFGRPSPNDASAGVANAADKSARGK